MTKIGQYRISDVAKLIGISPSVIRLWEKHGLVSPVRVPSGQRYFTQNDLERVRTIYRMRHVEGLNLPAIKRLFPPDSGQVEDNPSSRHLGDNYRNARRRANMSLRVVAAETGIAASSISTFERSSQGLTVAALQRLATAYRSTVTQLSRDLGPSENGNNARTVVRSGAERRDTQISPDIERLQLAENLTLLDCQKWVFAPGAASNGSYSHEGEEFIHVLAGSFEVTLADESRHTLGPGDSISFASATPHSWRAVGETPVVVIWVNTPQSF